MKMMVEISLYPLASEYIEPIKAFIERLNQYASLQVWTTATSTRVLGNNHDVMRVLTEEMERTHDEVGQAVFVCKFLNADNMQVD